MACRQEAYADYTGVVPIQDEVMLVARYGERTWGHWLGELLPKVAVCEHHFPGRFRYAVQSDCLGGDIVGQRLAESLMAYGVGPDRLLPVSDGTYRFERLWALTPVWTDRMMHPDVMSRMRGIAPEPGPSGSHAETRIALFRGDNDRRQIVNSAEVIACLRRHGFDIVDIATRPFAEQVALFASATTIFSILGSGLAGLIYARLGVHVMSAAPEEFGDRFFYAMMQAKSARYADLRGPVAGAPLPLYRDSPFHLDTAVHRSSDRSHRRNTRPHLPTRASRPRRSARPAARQGGNPAHNGSTGDRMSPGPD